LFDQKLSRTKECPIKKKEKGGNKRGEKEQCDQVQRRVTSGAPKREKKPRA